MKMILIIGMIIAGGFALATLIKVFIESRSTENDVFEDYYKSREKTEVKRKAAAGKNDRKYSDTKYEEAILDAGGEYSYELVDKCESVEYKELKNNPDAYIGKYIKVEVYIRKDLKNGYFQACTGSPKVNAKRWCDEKLALVNASDRGLNIRAGDVLTVYGVYKGISEDGESAGISGFPVIAAILTGKQESREAIERIFDGVSFVKTKDDSENDIFTAEVENTSDIEFDKIEIEVSCLDVTGEKIDFDFCVIENWKPGKMATVTFNTFSKDTRRVKISEISLPSKIRNKAPDKDEARSKSTDIENEIKYNEGLLKAGGMYSYELADKCESVEYKELENNPEAYIGRCIKVEVYIRKDLKNGYFYACTGSPADEAKNWFIDDLTVYAPSNTGLNLKKKDAVTIYGVYKGLSEIKGPFPYLSVELPELTAIYKGELESAKAVKKIFDNISFERKYNEWGYINFSAEIENTTDNEFKTVEVKANYLNNAGEKIGGDSYYIKNWKPGELTTINFEMAPRKARNIKIVKTYRFF